MIIVFLAVGTTACIILPPAAVVAAIWWGRSLRQGSRLDRSGGDQ